jgi:hypothetical protein
LFRHQIGDIEQRIDRQLAAIEAGVDPVLVGERIPALNAERQDAETAVSGLENDDQRGTIDVEEACAVFEALPDLGRALGAADPPLRRAVYDAFRLSIEVDRNTPQARLKALVSRLQRSPRPRRPRGRQQGHCGRTTQTH